jgi:hypothetical protein
MTDTWRNRVLSALKYPSLALGAAATSTLVATSGLADLPPVWEKDLVAQDPLILPNTLNSTATDRYAGHRSHSSHGSHRSSSGGTRATPAPRYVPPPIVTVPAPSTSETNVPVLSTMVVRVQAALMRRGYYNGDIDGVLGPETRTAIQQFQQREGLPQTGRMDLATLTKLNISIP